MTLNGTFIAGVPPIQVDIPDSDDWRERFASHVDINGACHMWMGPFHGNGYGLFQLDGRPHPAHRIAYTIAHGYVPSGLVIDHLCANKWCVNPSHLEAVTNGENVRRGSEPHLVGA
jgi:hypothetical protein